MVDVFFDFVCPYVYIASARARLLRREFGLEVRWRPWELYPATTRPSQRHTATTVSERVQALATEIELPIQPPAVRANSRCALLGSVFAEEAGFGEAYRDAVFAAHWRERRDIGDIHTLTVIAGDVGLDAGAFRRALDRDHGADALRTADRDAEVLGVQLAPTWVFGTQLYVGNTPFADNRAAAALWLQACC